MGTVIFLSLFPAVNSNNILSHWPISPLKIVSWSDQFQLISILILVLSVVFLYHMEISKFTEMVSLNNHFWVPSQARKYTFEFLRAFNNTSFLFLSKFRENLFILRPLFFWEKISFPILFSIAVIPLITFWSWNP